MRKLSWRISISSLQEQLQYHHEYDPGKKYKGSPHDFHDYAHECIGTAQAGQSGIYPCPVRADIDHRQRTNDKKDRVNDRIHIDGNIEDEKVSDHSDLPRRRKAELSA